MTTTADDISVVLSGGTVNINPNNSLGGDPSSAPLLNDSLNNLFDDVTSDESADGIEDYRCVYVFNDGDTTVWSVQLWINADSSDGATVEIGIEDRNEVQRLTITGGVSGGSLTLQYNGTEFTTNYQSDLSVWASQLENTLQELTDENLLFTHVNVTAQNGGNGTVIFDIKWSGTDAKRNFDKIESVENSLEPNGSVDISLTTPSQGSPVNTIASEINVETTPPGGVGFFVASQISPLFIPRLNPDEGFPLWVKRVVPAGTVAKENDGFTLRISAQSLEP